MKTPICTCAQYDPREALQIWSRRAAPIVARLIRHGHPVDSRNMTRTVGLVIMLETMDPAVFADEHRHRSHHLPGCPWAARNHGTLPRGRSVHPPVNIERLQEWAEEVDRFLARA